MNRRDALARVAVLMGGSVIGAEFFLTSCSSPASTSSKAGETAAKFTLNPTQLSMLDEVGDTILPATKTPGAKAAKIGSFMLVMVRDCYKPADQQIFLTGLTKLDEASQKQIGKAFMAADPAQRTAVLTKLDAEQKEFTKNQRKDDPGHYFRMMKELTLLGYFTSEVGATQALRYLPVPGRYDGDVPYKKGDRAWATS
ncbi:twin-arginine translocation pathway signal protein [Hymenobacter psoromatis]|nr:twin-arginine translocation pathway signal protein [Hymenobacter psoromatis]